MALSSIRKSLWDGFQFELSEIDTMNHLELKALTPLRVISKEVVRYGTKLTCLLVIIITAKCVRRVGPVSCDHFIPARRRVPVVS